MNLIRFLKELNLGCFRQISETSLYTGLYKYFSIPLFLCIWRYSKSSYFSKYTEIQNRRCNILNVFDIETYFPAFRTTTYQRKLSSGSTKNDMANPLPGWNITWNISVNSKLLCIEVYEKPWSKMARRKKILWLSYIITRSFWVPYLFQ